MILACHNLSKSFGDQVIVKDGSFHIKNHEKAALVGLNGAGKSTIRSEERRVGKECRSRWSPYH